MARMHELASASAPYERVPNILRYTVNNLFIIIYLGNHSLEFALVKTCSIFRYYPESRKVL